ncbi:Uncharacterized protein DAT39_022838, partial [Clarias magur]
LFTSLPSDLKRRRQMRKEPQIFPPGVSDRLPEGQLSAVPGVKLKPLSVSPSSLTSSPRFIIMRELLRHAFSV